MSKVTAIANQKGGVGKTFITVNLAAKLALDGNRVLLIDNDPQGNATACLLDDLPESQTVQLYEEFCTTLPVEARENLFLFGASKILSDITTKNWEVVDFFADNLETLIKGFDYVFIDCPPVFGNLQTAALTASNFVVIPTEASKHGEQSVEEVMKTIKGIRKRLNPQLEIAGILMNKTSKQKTSVQAHHADSIRDTYGQLSFETEMLLSTKAEQSVSMQQSLFEWDAAAARHIRLVDMFREFMERIQEKA